MGDINAELASLKSRIDLLRTVYAVLFFGSLVVILLQYTAHVAGLTPLWAIFLGSAVATRLYRQSLVNKYNTALSGGKPNILQ